MGLGGATRRSGYSRGQCVTAARDRDCLQICILTKWPDELPNLTQDRAPDQTVDHLLEREVSSIPAQATRQNESIR